MWRGYKQDGHLAAQAFACVSKSRLSGELWREVVISDVAPFFPDEDSMAQRARKGLGWEAT